MNYPDWLTNIFHIFLAALMLMILIAIGFMLFVMCLFTVIEHAERISHNRRIRRHEEEKLK